MNGMTDRDRATRHIARNLRERMLELDMPQCVLARKAGVTQPAISNYVHGRREPNAYALVRMARALGCTVDDLLDGVA